MRTSIRDNINENMIQYWQWKDGHFTQNLKGALEYAREYQQHDVYWLELEVAKRNVGKNW